MPNPHADAGAAGIRKISVDQLRPGMYVHDLNCGWLDHLFWRRRFLVRGADTIKAIVREGISELYIDTARGADVAPPTPPVPTTRLTAPRPPRSQQISLSEERRRAHMLDQEARHAIRTVLAEVKSGQPADPSRLRPVVGKMVASVLRQADALVPAARSRSADRYALSHPVSSCALMIAFGQHLGLDQPQIEEAAMGAMLHDLGKARISEQVLNKPGRLTPQESVHVRTHVVESRSILLNVPEMSAVAMSVAAQHHERFDGSGYPNRLRGDQISVYGHMAAIIDVYDALTSDSCYHAGIAPTEALRRLHGWSGTQFKPELVQAFIRTVGIYPVGSLVRLSNGLLGVVLEQRPSDLLRPAVKAFYDTGAGRYVMPERIDLARRGAGGWVSIESAEAFGRWGIDPGRWVPD